MKKRSQNYQKIGVIGGGAWGTALAQRLALAGRDTLLWAYEDQCVSDINKKRQNSLYLPDINLHNNITATSDIKDLADMDAILSVAPAQHTRNILEEFLPFIREGLPIVLCSKGIEISSHSFMSQVLDQVSPKSVAAVLSGPSFAIDVARGLPTAVTLACENKIIGQKLVEAIGTPTFRPYLSKDVIGAEVGGAVKNVLAIACGIVVGKGFGKSAHAAVIARGYAEMTRLGIALGCKPETLGGLCGLGDLVLTCSSEQSRNMSCGLSLGKGITLNEIISSRNSVTEGVATAPVLEAMAKKLNVDMPICKAMSQILSGKVSVDKAIKQLLSREITTEI